MSGILVTGCNLINPQPAEVPTPSPLDPNATLKPLFDTYPTQTTQAPASYEPLPTSLGTITPVVSPVYTPILLNTTTPTALTFSNLGWKTQVDLNEVQTGQPWGEAQISAGTTNQILLKVFIQKQASWSGHGVSLSSGSCQAPGTLISPLNPLANSQSTNVITTNLAELQTYPSVIVTVSAVNQPSVILLCGSVK